jgi:hypothetical protein
LPRLTPPKSFDEAELVAAAAMVDVETAAVREEAGHSATALSESFVMWQACNAEIIGLPSASSYGRGQNATTEDRCVAQSFHHTPFCWGGVSWPDARCRFSRALRE